MSKADQSVESFFRDIDKDYIGIQRAEDETFSYKATDVLIQQHWELPIVVQWPKSKISFEFSSLQGDLSFSIMFVAALEEGQDENDLEVETIEEMARTSSGTELQEGSFELPCEGVLFFVWDNTFDWSANKKLSYSIEVFQPSFSVPEEDRLKRVEPLLKDALEIIETSSIRLADAEDFIIYQGNNVLRIEEQIKALEAELALKRKEQEDKVKEEVEMLDMIEDYYDRISGIGIRCLKKHLMMVVIGYLDMGAGVNYVCKYWAQLAAESRVQIVDAPEHLYRPKLAPIIRTKTAAPKRAAGSSGAGAQVAAGGIATENRTEKTVKTEQSTSTPGSGAAESASAELISAAVNTAGSSSDAGLTPTAAGGAGGTVSAAGAQVQSPSRPGFARPRQIRPDSAAQPAAVAAGAADAASQFTPGDAGKSARASAQAGAVAAAAAASASKQSMYVLTHPQIAADSPAQPAGDPDAAAAAAAADQKGPETIGPTKAAAAEADLDQGKSSRVKKSSTGRDLEIPVVAEGKSSRTHRKVAGGDPAAQPRVRAKKGGDAEANLVNGMMTHVKKIRSEQQLSSLIDYIQAGYVKIESLENEKRRLKKQIRTWNAAFEKTNKRPATTKERKLMMKEQYLDYEQVSAMLKVRTAKMEELLTSVGLTHNDFIRLRDRRTADWINSAHNGTSKLDKAQIEALVSPPASGGGISSPAKGDAATGKPEEGGAVAQKFTAEFVENNS